MKTFNNKIALNLDSDAEVSVKGFRAADAGFCPQMELYAGAQDVLQDAKFTEAITQEEALQALMLRFYKFTQIKLGIA